MSGSLSVIGTGFKAVSHLTQEARQQIESADRVFFSVDNPIIEAWILEVCPAAVTLADLYVVNGDRMKTYHAMANRVADAAKEGHKVCMIFYGHPGMCCIPGHMAIKIVRAAGLKAEMLPGISTLDCLVADLGIDIATFGFQSYGATDFLTRKPCFDSGTYLILWQIGMVGDSTYKTTYIAPKILDFYNQLNASYTKDHPIIYYEASSHLLIEPVIKPLTLHALIQDPPGWATTVVIPPAL